ncbi:MAG: MFS transporter [Cyanobacteria bacterium SW_9_44_58]|nr:MAG: MFS transporter [Cyanobacteria bacterium SW_9_44_58]
MTLSALFSRFPFLKTAFEPNFPFSPKQFPFFYGWVIAVITTIGTLFSIPGQTAGISVFTEPVLTATGLSRVQLSSAYLAGTLGSGLLLPLGGRLMDRVGARLTVILSSLGLGLTLLYLSFCDYLIAFLNSLFSSVERSLVGGLVMGVGFVALRFTGQGILTLVSRNTLGKWFDRRRGFVSGIANVFISFSFSATPLLLSFGIDGFGWRGAWLGLALFVGLGMSFLGWLFYRDNPEICGLTMDGLPEETSRQQASNASEEIDSDSKVAKVGELTAAEAIKTVEFWGITLALSIHGLTVTGITFNIVDLGQQSGLSEQQAVGLFLPIGILSTVTGFLVGLISDRARLKWLVIAFLVLQLFGYVGMAHLELYWWWMMAIAGLGISGGFYATLTSVFLPRLFGRAHLGAISGMQMRSMVMASAIGPVLLAKFKEIFGSYQQGLYVRCLLIPISLGLTIFSRE